MTLLVLGLLFGWNMWNRDFSRFDEVRVAEVARQMEATGDWLTPRICGQPYLDQPPLTGWLAASFHTALDGDSRWSCRLPIVLAAVLGLWLTFIVGKKLFDGRTGFLAVVIQASTYLYFRSASWLDDDLLFAVFVQLAVVGFALSTRRGCTPRWAIAGWLGLAGCALTKSAILGFLLVGGALLFFFFLEGGTRTVRLGLKRARAWPGVLLFVLLVVPWYAAVGVEHGSEFFLRHVVGQHIDRLMGAPYDARSPLYYILAILRDFLPWSLFVPLAFLYGKDRLRRHGHRLAFFWLLVMFVALSFVSSKKPGYLLVIWSPVSLLIAAAFLDTGERYSLWEGFLREGVFKVVPVLMKVPLFIVLIAAVAYFSGVFGSSVDERVQRLLADKESIVWSLGLGTLAAVLSFAMASRVRRFTAKKSLAMAAFEMGRATLFLFFAAGFLNGGLNALNSSRVVLDRLATQVPAGASLALYGRLEPDILYYVNRPGMSWQHFPYPRTEAGNEGPGKEVEPLRKYIEQPKQVFLVTTKAEYKKLASLYLSLAPNLHEVDAGLVSGGRTYVLLSNKEGAAKPSATGG